MRLYVSMHADKEMEQKAFKEVPAITFARFSQFHCFSSRMCQSFERDPPWARLDTRQTKTIS